jgi:hypothetical protein
MHYATQEASFATSGSLVDGTVNRLVYKRQNKRLEVFVTRTLAQRKSLAELTAIRLKDQQRALPFYELGGRAERTVAGRAATEVRITFDGDGGRAYQRSASFLVDVRLLVVAVQGPAVLAGEVDATFEHLLSTMTFRAPDH